MIDDSVWPEENDLRRRFLSDEGAAFTLLFRFENGRARERDPLALMVNKSPEVFIFIREIDMKGYFQPFISFPRNVFWLKDDK